MTDDVFWLGLLLAPLAAAPTLTLVRREPRYARAIAISSAICVAAFAAKLALGLRFRHPFVEALSFGLAFAAVCAWASCGRAPIAANAHKSLAAVALVAVVFAYVLVLAAFGASRLFTPREPTSIVEMSSGFVCERGRWAIPGDGGSWATLYVILPNAPFLMRNVAFGSASDTDGGFDCADALARHREPRRAPNPA